MGRWRNSAGMLQMVNDGRRCTVLEGLGHLDGLMPTEPAGRESPRSGSASRSASINSDSKERKSPVENLPPVASARRSPYQRSTTTRRSVDRLHRGSTLEAEDSDVLDQIRQLTLPEVNNVPRQPKRRSRPSSREAKRVERLHRGSTVDIEDIDLEKLTKKSKVPVLPFVEQRSGDSPALAAIKRSRAQNKGKGAVQRDESPKKKDFTSVEKKAADSEVTGPSDKRDGSRSEAIQRRSFSNYREVINSALPPEENKPINTHRRRSDELILSKLPAKSRASLGTVKLEPIGVVADSAVAALFESDEASRDGAPVRKLSSSRFNTNVSDRAGSKDTSLSKDTDTPAMLSPEVLQRLLEAEGAGRLTKRYTVLEPVMPSQRLNLQRRAACEALRLFVFGEVGNENVTHPKMKNNTYYEPMGTDGQIRKLYQVWLRLDDDGSGRVDPNEFRDFLNRKEVTKAQRLQGDKVMELLLGRNNALQSFAIEDMMRIIWPCSDSDQLQLMLEKVQIFKKVQKSLVAEPPVISDEDLDALVRTFRYLDKQKKGYIYFRELVDAALVDKEGCDRLMADWDVSGEGELSMNVFLIMMCPSGHRLYQDFHIGYDKHGNCVEKMMSVAGTEVTDEDLDGNGWAPLETLPKLWLKENKLHDTTEVS